MRIEEYKQDHEGEVIKLLKDEQWTEYVADDKINAFRSVLPASIVYVAYEDEICCGYIRGVKDSTFAVYISDLLVKKEYRNIGIGQKLLERVKADYKNIHTYVLSDEDKYYEKKRYNRVGSVFEIE